jgi:hypothetical protein
MACIEPDFFQHLLALHLRMKLLLESPIGYDDRDNDDRIALQSVIRGMT